MNLLTDIIVLVLLIAGVFSIFRPMLLIYLFAFLQLLIVALTVTKSIPEFKIIQFGSTSLYATDYLIIILGIVLSIFLLKGVPTKNHKILASLKSPISKMIIALFIWKIFLGIFSYEKGLHFQNILRQLSTESLMFLAVLVPLIENIDDKKHLFIRFMCLCSVALCMIAIFRYVFATNLGLTSSGTLRAISGNSIIILMIPICYILFYSRHFNTHAILGYGIVALMVIGIVLAGHRSGLLVLILIFTMHYFELKAKKLDYAFIPLWAISILIVVAFLASTIKIQPGQSFISDLVLRFEDTFDMENKTTKDRLDIWKSSMKILKEDPLIGLGVYPVYINTSERKNSQLPVLTTQYKMPAHNIFVSILIYEGFVGLGLLIATLYIIFRQIRFISQFGDNYYATFFKIYFLSFLLFSLFNTTFSNFVGKTYFFIILGYLNVESSRVLSSLIDSKVDCKRQILECA